MNKSTHESELRPDTAANGEALEKSYLEAVADLDKVIRVTAQVSLNQHGIDTDGRGVRATKIFTRQTLTALSFGKMVPRLSHKKPRDSDLWDFGSVASLTRNLIEGYLAFHYFGAERISAQEAELRFFILQLHRNVELYQIQKSTNPKNPNLTEFEIGIPDQKERIRTHPFMSSLTESQRSRALRGDEMYKTKADFERELETCKNLRRDYRYLSNLVHPLPLSIERIDNDSGRGTGSDADVSRCLLCVLLASRYLAATTSGLVDFFEEPLVMFRQAADEIRPVAFD